MSKVSQIFNKIYSTWNKVSTTLPSDVVTDNIYHTGNVGIKNVSPTEALDVAGNIKFSQALMPNNLPGNSGEVLISQGINVAPIWTPLPNTTVLTNTDNIGNTQDITITDLGGGNINILTEKKEFQYDVDFTVDYTLGLNVDYSLTDNVNDVILPNVSDYLTLIRNGNPLGVTGHLSFTNFSANNIKLWTQGNDEIFILGTTKYNLKPNESVILGLIFNEPGTFNSKSGYKVLSSKEITSNSLISATASIISNVNGSTSILTPPIDIITEALGFNATGELVKSTSSSGAKKYRIIQALAAGNNTITHNLALTIPFATIVEVRDDVTGAIINVNVLSETTNSLIINVPVSMTGVRITILA